MTTFENADPLPDWEVPPTRHCGQLCFDRTCPVCLDYIVPPNIELATE